MYNFETVILLVVCSWIVVSLFLFFALEDQIVKKVKLTLGGNAQAIGKNTFSNPLQNLKNVIFFFKYKVSASDTDEIRRLIRKGKSLNTIYFGQFIIIGVFMINYFESLRL